MRKVLSIILLFTLILSLCACSSDAENNVASRAELTNATRQNEDMVVFEEPLLVWEDNNIRIELVSFYQERIDLVDPKSATEKGITFRYYNKSNYDVLVQLREAYLGIDAVQILTREGSGEPAAGKATKRNYIIQNFTGSSTSALESMDDLYQLEGSFWVGITHDPNSNKIDESYNVNFSLPSIMSGESEVTPETETITEVVPGNFSGDTVVQIGDTIETDYFSMNIEKYDSDTKIRAGSSQSGTNYYYESDKGDPFFYVYGTLKNLGGTPVDIRNIYVQFCFDGKYNYDGNVEGFTSDYGDFINDVSPLTSLNYYMFAIVPQELVDSFNTCTVRVGFTENFGYTRVGANGLPLFEYCDDVFSIKIK